MEDINKAKVVVDYYVLCNKLKDTVRSGWKTWNVQRERIESVAEHIFGVQSLAIGMWSQYEYNIDFNKVLFMLAVHELEETVIGDLTMWEISEDEKISKGHAVIQLILRDLLQGEQVEQLIHEFDARKTKEAVFAYQCDKLECDIQSKLYDEECCVDLNTQDNNSVAKDENVHRYLKMGKTWSEMWIQIGRDRYNYDPNFTEVSNYVEVNKIGV
jgi:Predicted hydrolases of HD superfamily